MILINELSGSITTNSLSLTGNLSAKSVLLSGSLINGGTQNLPRYEGETTITPSGETQILATKDTRVLQNITIEPIPSNYGMISWDGSGILIS